MIGILTGTLIGIQIGKEKRFMRKYVAPKPVLYGIAVVFLIINCFLGAYFSVILGKIVDAAGHDEKTLLREFIAGLIFVLVYIAASIIGGILKQKMIVESRRSIKHELFNAILRRPLAEHSESSAAEYINDLSNNLNLFETQYINNIFECIVLIAMFISASIITLTMEPFMLIIMIGLALITALVSKNIGKPVSKKSEEYMGKNAEYTAEIKDDFSAFYIIKSFGVLKRIFAKHERKNNEAEDAKFSLGFLQTICSGVGEFVGLLSTVLVMAAAAYFAIKGRFSAGMVIAFGSLIGQIISPIAGMPSIIAGFSASKPVIERFKELLSVSEDKNSKIEKKDFNTSIEVKHVAFSYDENKVLNDMSVTFKKNGKYAVVGQSGAGKSTLINVIMGLLIPDNGEVLYDGIGINEISDTDRAELISIVPQDTFLFNDTIRNNVTLFDEKILEEAILNALKKAGIWALVEGLPEGLDTVVAENGKNFSGGEKQRFALARAYLKNTPILILDEGTSAIDAETARMIEDKLIEDKALTLIAITHDTSDEHLKRFDEVIRLGV